MSDKIPVVLESGATVAPSMSVSGLSIPTQSASGVSIGTVSSNYSTVSGISAAQFSVTQGPQVQFSSSSSDLLETGSYPADIRYERTIEVELGMAFTGPNNIAINLSQDFTLNVIEANSNSLTITPTGGVTTYSVQEFCPTFTPITIVTASGGTAPYVYNVITDNSPFEADPISGQIWAMGWLDSVKVASSYTVKIRAQDAVGNYGYLTLTINVTTFAPVDIPGIIIFDPANVTVSGGIITQTSTGTTGYTLAGDSTLVSTSTYNGKPCLVYSNNTNAQMSSGPYTPGATSSALGSLFSFANVTAPVGCFMTLFLNGNANSDYNLASAGEQTAQYTWADKVASVTTTQGGIQTGAQDDTGTANQNGNIAGGGDNNQVIIGTSWFDSYENLAFCSSGTNTDILWGSYNLHNQRVTSINTYYNFTCNSFHKGMTSLNYLSNGYTELMQFIIPSAIQFWQIEALMAWLDRNYTLQTPFVNRTRKVINQMLPTYYDNFQTYRINDLYCPYNPEFTSYFGGSTNAETAFYLNSLYPSIHTIFQPSEYLGNGGMQVAVIKLTPPLVSWINNWVDPSDGSSSATELYESAPCAGLVGGSAHYIAQGGGFKTGGGVTPNFYGRWSQRYGYFECKAYNVKGEGQWPAGFWLYNDVSGGVQEFDAWETYGNWVQEIFSTLHPYSGEYIQALDVPIESDWSTNIHRVAWDWATDGNGNDIHTRYMDRYYTGQQIFPIENYSPNPMHINTVQTCGGAGGTVDNTTPSTCAITLFEWKCWLYPSYEITIQPPQPTSRPSFSPSTRGNGNTLTLQPTATFRFPLTSTIMNIYSYRPDVGETQLATNSTGAALSYTDTTTLQTYDIIGEMVGINANGTHATRIYLPATANSLTGTYTLISIAHGQAFAWTPQLYGPLAASSYSYTGTPFGTFNASGTPANGGMFYTSSLVAGTYNWTVTVTLTDSSTLSLACTLVVT